jgi:hypothetical protein
MKVIVATHFLPYHVCNGPNSSTNPVSPTSFNNNLSPSPTETLDNSFKHRSTKLDEIELSRHDNNVSIGSGIGSGSSSTGDPFYSSNYKEGLKTPVPSGPIKIPGSGDNHHHHHHHHHHRQNAPESPESIADDALYNSHEQQNKSFSAYFNNSIAFATFFNQSVLQHQDANQPFNPPSSSHTLPYYTPHHRSRISSIGSNASWRIEPYAGGNVGLHNAIHASEGKAFEKRVWVGILPETREHISPITWPKVQSALVSDHASYPVLLSDSEMHLYYERFCMLP